MAGDSNRQGCQVSRKGLFSNQPALTVVLNKFADGASASPPPPAAPERPPPALQTRQGGPLAGRRPVGRCSSAVFGPDPAHAATAGACPELGPSCDPGWGRGGGGGCRPACRRREEATSSRRGSLSVFQLLSHQQTCF